MRRCPSPLNTRRDAHGERERSSPTLRGEGRNPAHQQGAANPSVPSPSSPPPQLLRAAASGSRSRAETPLPARASGRRASERPCRGY